MLNLEDALNRLYHEQHSCFEGVQRNQEIAPEDRVLGRQHEASLYAPGIGNAVYDLLTGRMRLNTHSGIVNIVCGEDHVYAFPLNTVSEWLTDEMNKPNNQAVALLALALALLDAQLPYSILPDTAAALRKFIRLATRAGLNYPMATHALAASTKQESLRRALHFLTDTLDYEVRLRFAQGVINTRYATDPERARVLNLPCVNLATLIHPLRQQRVDTSHKARLARLTQRGGAALLLGPPGTFKTETAKQLAVQQQLKLVIAKGAPGIEDRDFLGGIYPSAQGPQWIDGPISRAFVSAASQPTLLLIDEVLRYHPDALNVLIGAMDSVSTQEALAAGLSAQDLHGERHYLLPLPNGDHLCCPVSQLTWVMTTNLGADHVQTADHLDAALLSRIDLVLDFDYPDEDVARQIYRSVSQDEMLADKAYAIELLTRDALIGPGAQVLRAMDARKTIAMIKEAKALMQDGEDCLVALMLAFNVVGLPHCCARDTAGKIEESTAAMLRQRLNEEVLT